MRTKELPLVAELLALVFENLDRSTPQDLEWWAEDGFWLAEVLERQGKKAEALVTRLKITWEMPESPWARQARGIMAAARGKEETAPNPAKAP